MVNEATLSLIKGFEKCSLKAYDDRQPFANIANPMVIVLGVVTIGYGHTGPEVKRDTVWTQQQCDDALVIDIANAEAKLPQFTKRILNPNQYGALVSFIYNCSGRYYSKLKTRFVPYQLWTLINAMADEALIRSQWIKTAVTQNNIPLPGLVRRRQAEVDLFFTPINKP